MELLRYVFQVHSFKYLDLSRLFGNSVGSGMLDLIGLHYLRLHSFSYVEQEKSVIGLLSFSKLPFKYVKHRRSKILQQMVNTDGNKRCNTMRTGLNVKFGRYRKFIPAKYGTNPYLSKSSLSDGIRHPVMLLGHDICLMIISILSLSKCYSSLYVN